MHININISTHAKIKEKKKRHILKKMLIDLEEGKVIHHSNIFGRKVILGYPERCHNHCIKFIV